jgi:hypothetical protein
MNEEARRPPVKEPVEYSANTKGLSGVILRSRVNIPIVRLLKWVLALFASGRVERDGSIGPVRLLRSRRRS